MDALSLLLNVTALVASFASLVIATVIALRQARIAHRANQLPVLLDLIYQQRSLSFRKSEEKLWDDLPRCDPSAGLGGLREESRDRLFEVALLYQHLAYMIGLGIIDREVAILPMHYRMIRTWDTLAPFVQHERGVRNDPYGFMNAFEYLAESVRREDVVKLTQRMGKKILRN
jgi:hypothetical protein